MKNNIPHKKLIKKNIIQNIFNLKKLSNDKYIANISKAIDLCYNCIFGGNKIIFCGNGGSASDSQHLTAEIVSKFLKKRRPLPAISLTTNTSTITSIGNDFSFDYIFSKQVEAIGNKNDLLFAISTSGKSKNIINAIKSAKKIGIKIILLTGNKILNKSLADLIISTPAKRVDRIQELHILIGHTICEILETELC